LIAHNFFNDLSDSADLPNFTLTITGYFLAIMNVFVLNHHCGFSAIKKYTNGKWLLVISDTLFPSLVLMNPNVIDWATTASERPNFGSRRMFFARISAKTSGAPPMGFSRINLSPDVSTNRRNANSVYL
jgi:hypothetical protein